MTATHIHVKGAREHNLKNIEVRIPRGKLVVITGPSGSGKSSLAFDTIYAEGYRKYMESLSTQARQVLEQLKRPDVDFIHGLSPVLAIEQRTGGSSPRNTIATATEIADYAQLLWALHGEQTCPKDGGRVTQRSLDDNIARVLALAAGERIILLAPLMRAKPSVLREELPRLRQRGFQRVRIDGEIKTLDDPHIIPAASASGTSGTSGTSGASGTKEIAVDLVVDRLVATADQRSRLADSLELAFREGKDRVIVLAQSGGSFQLPSEGAGSSPHSAWREIHLSQSLACEICGDVFDKLTPKCFSFNHTEGACPTCGGLGRKMRFVPELVVPDAEKSVREGAIKPWRIGGKNLIIKHGAILKQLAEQLPFDPEKPWKDLPAETRHMILHGAPGRLFLFKLRRMREPRAMPFAGVLADLETSWRETDSDGYRARLTTFMVSGDCPECHGARLNARSAAVCVRVARASSPCDGEAAKSSTGILPVSTDDNTGRMPVLLQTHGLEARATSNPRAGSPCYLTFPEFLRLDVAAAHAVARELSAALAQNESLREIVTGIEQRLHFLVQTGLGYLTLDRDYDTLSGGEAQRVRLATQLGMGLMGVIYVLDEPSIGLHPADNERLLAQLRELRDRGNTVLIVEHDEETMRIADEIIELGPEAGVEGGRILFQGTPAECAAQPARVSRTGPFLARKAFVEKNAKTLGNRFGNGTGTLDSGLRTPTPGLRTPAMPADTLARQRPIENRESKIENSSWLTVRGASQHNLRNIDARFPIGLLTCVTGVSGSGKSTLVNDILAIAAARKLNGVVKLFPGKHRAIDGLEFFEKLVQVDQEPIGRSPRSNPATYTKLLDQLRDLFAQAPLAKVRGYKASRFSFNVRGGRCERCQGDGVIKLDMQFMADAYAPCPSCAGRRFNRETLEILFHGKSIADVLDMTVREAMQLFRNIPRVMEKLETLAAVGLGYLTLGQSATTLSGGEAQRIKLSLELSKRQQGNTLYILDEPTTGLHWTDIQNLMDLLFKLRDAGNTIIVIEHNLDVINLADWIIDLGPGGGAAGGEIVYAGARSEIERAAEKSQTGAALKRWRLAR